MIDSRRADRSQSFDCFKSFQHQDEKQGNKVRRGVKGRYRCSITEGGQERL